MNQVREMYTNWLQQLSSVLGKKLVLGDEVSCAVEFEGDITIQLTASEDTGGFYIYAVVCPFPEDISAQYRLMHYFLRLNLEQAETLQASFCLSDDNRSVLLTFARSLETYDANRFVHSFLQFYDVCEEVKTALHAATQA